jgi:hypothetical protein
MRIRAQVSLYNLYSSNNFIASRHSSIDVLQAVSTGGALSTGAGVSDKRNELDKERFIQTVCLREYFNTCWFAQRYDTVLQFNFWCCVLTGLQFWQFWCCVTVLILRYSFDSRSNLSYPDFFKFGESSSSWVDKFMNLEEIFCNLHHKKQSDCFYIRIRFGSWIVSVQAFSCRLSRCNVFSSWFWSGCVY